MRYHSEASSGGYIKTEALKPFFDLLKPRVMALVVFTALIGLYITPGNIHPLIAFVAIFCVTLGAGGSAAINMWYDRDIDAIMLRTQKRPLVLGLVLPDEALALGIILSVVSVILMAVCVNIASGLLLAFTILYYVFVYTMWLKRSSVQNVVIGGVSGALPPMIGSTAVTGNITDIGLVLFLIIFIWTPPHSWALALFRKNDYKSCKVPMMPVVKGDLYTKKMILGYTILMIVVSFLPYFIDLVGNIYLITTTILDSIFLYYAILLFKDSTAVVAKKFFLYTIFYLFVLFLSLPVL